MHKREEILLQFANNAQQTALPRKIRSTIFAITIQQPLFADSSLIEKLSSRYFQAGLSLYLVIFLCNCNNATRIPRKIDDLSI